MKFGVYELVAYFRSTNEPLEEMRVNNVDYFIAVPNKEYYVKVIIHKNENGVFPMEYARISLIIDGLDVNYWKRLDMSAKTLEVNKTENEVSATFWGFKKSESEILSFVFNNKVDNAKNTSRIGSNIKSNIGQIKVEIFEAEVLNAVISNISGCSEVPTTAILPGTNTHANSKFWTNPSVATVGGSKLNGVEKFVPIPKWENKPHPITGSRNDPLIVLEMSYHTEELCKTLEHIYTQDDLTSTTIDSSSSSSSSSLKRSLNSSTVTSNKRTTQPVYVDLTDPEDGSACACLEGPVKDIESEKYISQQVVCVDITDEQCVTDTVITQQIELNNLCN